MIIQDFVPTVVQKQPILNHQRQVDKSQINNHQDKFKINNEKLHKMSNNVAKTISSNISFRDLLKNRHLIIFPLSILFMSAFSLWYYANPFNPIFSSINSDFDIIGFIEAFIQIIIMLFIPAIIAGALASCPNIICQGLAIVAEIFTLTLSSATTVPTLKRYTPLIIVILAIVLMLSRANYQFQKPSAIHIINFLRILLMIVLYIGIIALIVLTVIKMFSMVLPLILAICAFIVLANALPEVDYGWIDDFGFFHKEL